MAVCGGQGADGGISRELGDAEAAQGGPKQAWIQSSRRYLLLQLPEPLFPHLYNGGGLVFITFSLWQGGSPH